MAMRHKDRRFGVEIECLTPDGDGDMLGDLFLSDYPEWDWCYDGGGLEFKTPPLSQDDGFDEVKSAMGWLKDRGFYAGTSAGMHVHIEASDLTVPEVKRVVRSWAHNQEHINLLVDSSRVRNSYCSAWNTSMLNMLNRVPDDGDWAYDWHTTPADERPCSWDDFDRMLALGVPSLENHGTIEFRQHHSTLDGDEATAWVRFLLGFVRANVERKAPMPTYNAAELLLRRTKPRKVDENIHNVKLSKRSRGQRLLQPRTPATVIIPGYDETLDADWDDDLCREGTCVDCDSRREERQYG